MTTRPDLAPTAARGYGAEHQRLRAEWKTKVEAGGVNCAHCREKIQPGTPWDLGHDDNDRTTYTGPEHRSCNRKHKAQRAAERANHTTRTTNPEPLPWPDEQEDSA